MKRSEMVQRMAEYWVRLLPGENPENMGVNHPLFEDIKESMGRLLTCIQDLGMYPPATMHYIDQPSGNTLCSERCEWDEE